MRPSFPRLRPSRSGIDYLLCRDRGCIGGLGSAIPGSFRATNATGIVSDNLFTSDISKSLGAEIYFSKPMNLIPFNYNLGLNYQYADGVQSVYAITGLSFIIYTTV